MSHRYIRVLRVGLARISEPRPRGVGEWSKTVLHFFWCELNNAEEHSTPQATMTAATCRSLARPPLFQISVVHLRTVLINL